MRRVPGPALLRTTDEMRSAGGFAIQGLGGMLIKEIKGDYNNCVGFPAQVRPSYRG